MEKEMFEDTKGNQTPYIIEQTIQCLKRYQRESDAVYHRTDNTMSKKIPKGIRRRIS